MSLPYFFERSGVVSRFSKLHPVVQLVYFLLCLIIIMSVNSPFFSAAALLGALIYSVKVNKKQWITDFIFTIVLIAVTSVFNMLFAHYGEDVLFAVNNTQFTLESLFYGFNQGMVLSSVIIWFSIFSKMFDSERVIYIFRFTPKLALIFSMVLGFIPRFKSKLKDIESAQLGLNGGNVEKGIVNKTKSAISNLSALVTYSLESSIITADSMEARGYNPKAVRSGRFRWSGGDAFAFALILSLSAFVLFSMITGKIKFLFDPVIISEKNSPLALLFFAVLELLPFFVDLVEDLLWKKSSAKI